MSMNLDISDTLGFTEREISECLEKRGLLSIELEFTRKCNLRCLYCYSSAGEPAKNEMSRDALRSAVSQAKDLGAKKIVLLGGGEPLLYDGFIDIIHYIRSLGIKQVMFTNATLMTRETARFLFQNEVSVIVKHNSMSPEVQDMLAGMKGAFKNIRQGIRNLTDAGYPDEKAALGIQTVICRQNINELPSMWIWARENGIIPYFEVLTQKGRAKENMNLNVPSSEVKAVFGRIESIDREQFDIIWKSHPSIAAFSCKRHLYSCLINSQGNIQPCAGIDLPVGNIRDKSLGEILKNSAVIRKLRNVYENLEGRCRDCEQSRECYGCRGNAYQITGNYLASDPTCWRFGKVENENTTHICKQ